MSEFREALVKATVELGGDADLAESVTIQECKEVVTDAVSFIGGVDFLVVHDSALAAPLYAKVLSHWLAAGAVKGSGKVLKVLSKHARLQLPDVRIIVGSGVEPEYLKGCYDAGVYDPEVIAEGWKSNLPYDYLAAL